MRTPRTVLLRGRGGHTIVELVVAAGITVALAAVMIGIIANVMETARRASGGLLASNQAKVALDFIAQDLQSAFLERDGAAWLVATIQGDQSGAGDVGGSLARWTASGVLKPTGWTSPGAAGSSLDLDPVDAPIEGFRFGMAGVWLRFLAAIQDTNGSPLEDRSAPRAVGYQIVRHRVRDAAGSSERYSLFRSEVRPFHSTPATALRSTFAVGYDLFATAYNDGGASAGAGEPGGIRRPERDQILGNNVVDFGVRFFRRDPATGLEVLLFPSVATKRGFVATSGASLLPPAVGTPSHSYATAEMDAGFPEIAEIILRVLTDAGAQTIENLEAGRLGVRPAEYANDGEWWWGVALANSEIFTRRVEIKCRPQ